MVSKEGGVPALSKGNCPAYKLCHILVSGCLLHSHRVNFYSISLIV